MTKLRLTPTTDGGVALILEGGGSVRLAPDEARDLALDMLALTLDRERIECRAVSVETVAGAGGPESVAFDVTLAGLGELRVHAPRADIEAIDIAGY